LNGKPVTFTAAELLASKNLQPAHDIEKVGGVMVEVFAEFLTRITHLERLAGTSSATEGSFRC